MDRDTVILFVKRYLLVSIGAIALTTAIVFFFSYTFYHITSDDKAVSVRIVRENGKIDKANKFLWLHVIPKDTVTLKIESVEESSAPKSEYIKGMADGDTGIGFRSLDVNFTPQHDIAMNGEEFESCTFGKYPKVYGYTCGGSAGVTALNATDPLDPGRYISLPSRPIDIFSGSRPTSSERQLGAEPYQTGLLLLVANEVESSSGYMYENARLKYFTDTGEMTEIPLTKALETDQNGRYRLLTDKSGSSGFAIADYKKHSVDVYESFESTPKTITPSQAFVGVGAALLCDLNNAVLACYSGAAGDYTDSHEETESIREARDGSIELYDTKSGEKKMELTVPKDQAIESVCIDKYHRLYTLRNDDVELLTEHRGALKRQVLTTGVTTLVCGDTAYFTAENRAYAVRKDNGLTADLLFGSERIIVSSIHPVNSSVFLSGKFSSHLERMISFTPIPTDTFRQHERVAEVVARVVNQHKALDVDVRFTPQSVDFILPAYIQKDDARAKKLVEDTKQSDAVQFTPSLHNIFD